MTISATNPIAKAFEHTQRVLFQPFDLKKWFVLGFAAFLATLGGVEVPRDEYLERLQEALQVRTRFVD